MPCRAGFGTMSLATHNDGGNPMQVTALAEALVASRRPDGAISLEDLKLRLSRAGLEEFASAVVSLAQRVKIHRQDGSDPGPHTWL
jgi:hypothetical protein